MRKTLRATVAGSALTGFSLTPTAPLLAGRS
jgi:hypothetical protein